MFDIKIVIFLGVGNFVVFGFYRLNFSLFVFFLGFIWVLVVICFIRYGIRVLVRMRSSR